MTQFKKGDVVKRIGGMFKHGGMGIGDIDIVVEHISHSGVHLKRYGLGHSSENLQLLPRTLKSILGDINDKV